jgi:TOMM system kinase/cyclase fusion protein
VAVPPIDPTDVRAALGDGYELLELLGQGAYGTVYKAIQTRTGQTVAIKAQRLGSDLTEEQRTARVARFERETKLCATLSHPRIVRIIDTGRSESCLYMVFEFVPGETLTALLARRHTLPAAEAVALMVQLLDALENAHAQGIVHRDLKPDNLMVVSSGGMPYLKVLDFGIGAYITDTAVNSPSLTRSQEIIGTPSYSSPEQLRGEPATSKSDIYAWGLVLLECLTGRRVMDGATVAQVFHKQLGAEEVPLPPSLVLHPLGALLRRALAKIPRERASDAGRLASELREIRLGDLVGHLDGEANARPAQTLALESAAFVGEQRQATVMCCSLSVVSACSLPPDVETFDAIQRDQLNMCVDITTRFGGHVVGRLADRIITVFGFPHASDSDARRACRASLELSSRIESRRAILSGQRGVDLELRIGIHTGLVLVNAHDTLGGPAFNLAARLESLAAVGETLVSDATRGLLYRQLGFQRVEQSAIRGPSVPQKPYRLISGGPVGGDPLLETEHQSTLVGREAELETLRSHWGEAKRGNGRVVVLRGEAGVGKSRLVHEIRRSALDDGARCFECRSFPEEVNSALHPILALIREQLKVAGDQPEMRSAQLESAIASSGLDPAQAMPILASWLSLPTRHAQLQLSSERQREILLDALVRLLATTRPDEPRLIVIEDLHWSDPTTREFVSRLAESVPPFAVLVVLTARPELEQRFGGAHLLELQGLDREAVAQLVAAIAGEASIGHETLANIILRTDGIPLFVEELTRNLAAAGNVSSRSGIDQPSEIPSTIQDLLNSRLDQMGAAKETAQVAAAIGREFEVELLDAVCDRGPEALQAHLDSLVDASLLHHKLQAAGARYEFRHALIQEAAWESMLSARRRNVHGRIAKALEERNQRGEKPEAARLARHHELAGSIESAIQYRLVAGQEAAQASALREAIEHLSAGLRLLESVSDLKQRNSLEIDLRHSLGGVLIATEGLAAAPVVETFTRSWELVRGGAPSPIQSVRALRGLWTFHNARAEYTTAGEMIERMLESAAQQEGSEFHLIAHECAGQTALLVGKLKLAVQHSQECERWFDPALQRAHIVRYATDPRLNARSFACIALALLGQFDDAESSLATILEETEKLGAPGLKALMLGQAAWIDLLWSGSLTRPNAVRSRAMVRAQEAARLSDEIGFRFGQAYAGLIMSIAGSLDAQPQAVAALERTIHFWQLSGTQAILSWMLSFLAQGKLAIGDPDGALASAEAAISHCTRTGEAYGASEAHRALSAVLSAPGNPQRDPERALGAAEQALEIARLQEARLLSLRAAFSMAQHAPPQGAAHARAQLSQELKWFREQRQGMGTPLVADCLELEA